MILHIYAYGHPVLTKRADELKMDKEKLEELIENMFETMYNAHGVGLAAPQIGLSKRLFVIDTEQLKEDRKESKIPLEGIKTAFINPEITEYIGDYWPYEEGCLSIPGVNGEVERQVALKIKWQDIDGNHHERMFEGMEARVIMHEYDHIEGKLFTEYLNPLKLRLTRRKLDKIRKGKITTSYPMEFAS